MKLSFIIPTRNEARYLGACIGSIRAQGRDHEIIVVDTDSTDGTQRIARKHGTLLEEKKRGIGIARNTGAAHASGDVLIFADADVRFPPGFAHMLEQAFIARVAGGIFRLEPYDGGRYVRLLYGVANAIARFTIRTGTPFTAGSCFAYRRSAFEKAGGFDARFITNEDHELAQRVHRHGRVVFFEIPVYTSARRAYAMGIGSTLLLYLRSSMVYLLRKGSLKEYPALDGV